MEQSCSETGGHPSPFRKKPPPAKTDPIGHQVLSSRLFGRHIGDSAGYRSFGSQMAQSFGLAARDTDAIDRLGQAKVQHFWLAARSQHDVLWLYISMDDSFRVTFCERIRDLDCDCQCFG